MKKTEKKRKCPSQNINKKLWTETVSTESSQNDFRKPKTLKRNQSSLLNGLPMGPYLGVSFCSASKATRTRSRWSNKKPESWYTTIPSGSCFFSSTLCPSTLSFPVMRKRKWESEGGRVRDWVKEWKSEWESEREILANGFVFKISVLWRNVVPVRITIFWTAMHVQNWMDGT